MSLPFMGLRMVPLSLVLRRYCPNHMMAFPCCILGSLAVKHVIHTGELCKLCRFLILFRDTLSYNGTIIK